MLTTAEMATLRTVQESTLLDSGQIVEDTRVSDGAGGHTLTPVTVATLPCRIRPTELRRGEEEFADSFQSTLPYEIAFAAGTAVNRKQRIVINGKAYEIMAVRSPRTFDVGVKLLCKERIA